MVSGFVQVYSSYLGLYETRRDEQGNMNNVMIGTPLESPPKPEIPAAPELPVATSNGLKPPLALEIPDSPAEQIQAAQLPPIVHQAPITSSILGGKPEPSKGSSLPVTNGDESPLPLAPIATTVSPAGLMVPVVPASEAAKLPAPAIVGASETTLNSKKDKTKTKEGKSKEKKKFSWKRLFKFGKA